MEDALGVIVMYYIVQNEQSLNPCFNGRCTRSSQERISMQIHTVLILVLMEDALGGYIVILLRYIIGVLILVLMEDALGVKTTMDDIILEYLVLILVLMEDALGDTYFCRPLGTT